jgi:Holliday junction resolvase RusA-like endonuclease
MPIDIFIEGVPYSRWKVKGDADAAKQWSQDVINKTRGLPGIKHRCRINVTFILPLDKYPTDHPQGPDLDNLLKRLFDALNETIFCKAPGKDGCVTLLTASKRKRRGEQKTGVRLKINEIED